MMIKIFIKEFFLPCQANHYYPLLFRKNFIYFYLLTIFILKTLTIPIVILLPHNLFFATVVKETLIDLVNQERQKYNLPLLKENSILENSSFLKAQDMIKNNYFSHWSPSGLSPWYWFSYAGYDYQYAGENLAIGFLTSEEVFQAWMNSPLHRMNILNPYYREIGITVQKIYFNDKEVFLVVQHLAAPRKNPVLTVSQHPPSPTPSPLSFSSPSPLATSFLSPSPTAQVIGQEKIVQTPIVETRLEGVLSVQKSQSIPSFSQNSDLTFTLQIKKFFVKFFSRDYHLVLGTMIYLSLFLVIISLCLTLYFDYFVYHKFVIDYKDLIPRTMIFLSVLIFFAFFDYLKITQLIPHTILI